MDKLNLLSQQNYALLYNQEKTASNLAQTTTSDTDTSNTQDLERLWKYHFTNGKDLTNSIKEANAQYLAKYGMGVDEFKSLEWKEQVKLGKMNENYPLTGYTRDKEANISIWGKLMGYDPDFSQEEIDDLKRFINESGGLGFESAWSFTITDKNRAYSVDEAAELFTGRVQKAGLAKMFFESKPSRDGIDSVKISYNLVKSIELLDSNLRRSRRFQKEFIHFSMEYAIMII
ncbi:hypothetical protein [Campylobacter fetus]|uniref:hypothetical protein n=1 Tax=Campylobacter fetus TaxID=196 RepID=UPI000FCC9928|nr:hypothetical protein [Campylobacter fetus]RUT50014.1 hypothetical protein BWK67_06660 [Campylobacter fetus]RUT50275.1 hypothetical protein BWK51_06640 [Campylobacter fetus]